MSPIFKIVNKKLPIINLFFILVSIYYNIINNINNNKNDKDNNVYNYGSNKYYLYHSIYIIILLLRNIIFI
jgi:hypothetical protein